MDLVNDFQLPMQFPQRGFQIRGLYPTVILRSFVTKKFSAALFWSGDHSAEGSCVCFDVTQLSMRDTQGDGRLCRALAWILEHVAAQNRDQHFLVKCRSAPTQRRTSRI